jgi:hypothetical protein
MRSTRRSGTFSYLAHWIPSTSEYRFAASSSNRGAGVVKTGYGSAARGNWHHVAAVYANKDMQVYLNGVPFDRRTFDLNTGSTTPDNSLVMGARSYESKMDRYFRGKIDDVRVYDGALSDTQIWALYEGN